MTNHPRRSRSRLAQYGARLRTVNGRKVVEMRDHYPSRMLYQYRRIGDGIERRRLMADGSPFRDGSPWEPLDAHDIARMQSMRGEYHPILDPLGL